MLPVEAILEFRQIYKEEFGEELPMDQATEKAVLVFNLFRVLLKDGDESLTRDTGGEQNEN